MILLEEFEHHLEKKSSKDWNELFDFIPKIESTEKFGAVISENSFMPYVKKEPIVEAFLSFLIQYQWLPVFEWISWQAGKEILNSPDFDLNRISIKELFMLFTTIYRLDRFNEGFLVGKFEDGTILLILSSLRKKVTPELL